MQRVTITIEDELLEPVDALMRLRGYDSRSEAVRDIIRDLTGSSRSALGNRQAGADICV